MLLNRIYTRRVRPFFDPKVNYKLNPRNDPFFLVFVTNKCNSGCFSCTGRCDQPFGLPGFMDEPFMMNPNELDVFLDNLQGFRPKNKIRLTGGEPTLSLYLKEYSEVVRNHNRKIEVLTNGYNLGHFDPFLFDHIILDEHYDNRDLVKRLRKLLESKNYENYHINPMHYHYDIEKSFPEISKGVRCKEFMNSISLCKGIVYPCCNMTYLPGWKPEYFDLNKKLEQYGFTYDNECLKELLENWRYSLPDLVYKICSIGCYQKPKIKIYSRTHQ